MARFGREVRELAARGSTGVYHEPQRRALRAMSTLEEQMKALMAEAAATATEAAAAEAKAGKIRRKSKELTDQLSDMAAASDAWKSLHGILGSRRGSRDLSVYTDEALLEAFEQIDTDKSGQIDHAELSAAILKMDPKATDKVRRPPGPPHARRRRAPMPCAAVGDLRHDEIRRRRRRRQGRLRRVQEDHALQTARRAVGLSTTGKSRVVSVTS